MDLLGKRKNEIKNFFRKKSKLERLYYGNKQFIDYTFVSFVCTIILYLLYFFITWITKGKYIIANFVAYFVSFTILFLWNRKIFNSKPRRKKDQLYQIFLFIIFRVIGFIADSVILVGLIEYFKMPYSVSKVISSLTMFIFNYATNKIFIFNKIKLL